MAEVAKILNPMKNVIIPDLKAGCSLEQSCPSHSFKKFKEQNPDHLIISYINCSAEIKALSDIIVTSSNARKIINQLPKNENIIFAPDQHLGSYLNKITGRNMLLWRDRALFTETFSEEIVKLKIRNPKSEQLIECLKKFSDMQNILGPHHRYLNMLKIVVLLKPL